MKKTILVIALFSTGLIAQAATTKQVVDFYENKLSQIDVYTVAIQESAKKADDKAKAAQDALADSKAELDQANASLVKLAGDIKRLDDWGKAQWQRAEDNEKIAKQKTMEAHRNAVQRDIACGIFAIAGTILIMTCSGQIIGAIVKWLPSLAPYGILLEIGLTLFFLNLLFWGAEGALAVIYAHL